MRRESKPLSLRKETSDFHGWLTPHLPSPRPPPKRRKNLPTIPNKQALNCLPPFPSQTLLRLAHDAAPSHPARLSWLNESFALLKRARAQADEGVVQPPGRRAWPGSMLRSCYIVQEKIPDGKGKGKEKEVEEELSSEMIL